MTLILIIIAAVIAVALIVIHAKSSSKLNYEESTDQAMQRWLKSWQKDITYTDLTPISDDEYDNLLNELKLKSMSKLVRSRIVSVRCNGQTFMHGRRLFKVWSPANLKPTTLTTNHVPIAVERILSYFIIDQTRIAGKNYVAEKGICTSVPIV